MKKYRSDEIDKLILILNNDGVISVPTDTVYGLCCKVNSEISYERLVNLKNRPSNKSFPIMCSNINQIRNIASVGDREEKLINNFMPGAVTLVLKKHVNVNNAGFRDTDEVAIRMAPSDVLYKIINEVGPVFMTSANKSGEDVCKNIEQIEKVFPDLDVRNPVWVILSSSPKFVPIDSPHKFIPGQNPYGISLTSIVIKNNLCQL